MSGPALPEIWEWAEYYCPWCYIGGVRLHAIRPEYRGTVRMRIRAFPLEVVGGGPPNRHELEQEWWLAAIQEPLATFAPYQGDDWPTTTLPAFDGAYAAAQQGDDALFDFDLRVRRAFFAESRNIGRPDVIREIAGEADLDIPRFERDIADPQTRAAVLAEANLGRDQFRVRGTPTLTLEDGTRLRHPMAFPKFEHDLVVAVNPLSCHGDGCLELTRAQIERALVPVPANSAG